MDRILAHPVAESRIDGLADPFWRWDTRVVGIHRSTTPLQNRRSGLAPSVLVGFLCAAATARATVMVRPAGQIAPGSASNIYSSIQDAVNAAGDGEDVLVDGTDDCQPVHLVRRVRLIGLGDLLQSDRMPVKSCIGDLSFDAASIGSFVKGFVVASIHGDKNLSIKISNCHILGNVDIQADSGSMYIESGISGGGEDFGINSVVDIGHNVIEGSVTFPGAPYRDSATHSWIPKPGTYSFVHNNIAKGPVWAYQNECNGSIADVGGCSYPWPAWGPTSIRYVAKTPRAYIGAIDLDRALVPQGTPLHVRFRGLMAP